MQHKYILNAYFEKYLITVKYILFLIKYKNERAYLMSKIIKQAVYALSKVANIHFKNVILLMCSILAG